MGMCWGIAMAMSQNFALAPAHAHLNLLGWVTMAIYGTFYALTRETFSPRLAWINFICAALGVADHDPVRWRSSCHRQCGNGAWCGIGSLLSLVALLDLRAVRACHASVNTRRTRLERRPADEAFSAGGSLL